MPGTLADIPMGLISVGRLCHRNFLNIGLLFSELVSFSEKKEHNFYQDFFLSDASPFLQPYSFEKKGKKEKKMLEKCYVMYSGLSNRNPVLIECLEENYFKSF